jgi:drug/metabolite transporter (DMT)-like permease
LVGVSAGLSGVVLIAGANSLIGLGQSSFGQAAIILASVSSAVAAIQGRRLNDVPPELAAAGTLTCGAIILVPLSFVVEAPLHSTPSAGSIAALLFNAFVATALRSVIYFRLLRTIGSMGTTSVSYLKPAVGVLIGFALMGEELTSTAVMGLLAILLGVATISQLQFLISSWRLPQFVQRAVRTS